METTVTPIEAVLYNEYREEIEGYFWYTDDVNYAMYETLQRCNDENVGWSLIQLFYDDGTGKNLIAECDLNGQPSIFHEQV